MKSSRRHLVFSASGKGRLRAVIASAATAALTLSLLAAAPATAAGIPKVDLGKPVAGSSAKPVKLASASSHSATPTITRLVSGAFSVGLPKQSTAPVQEARTLGGKVATRTAGSWHNLGASGLSASAATPATFATNVDDVTSAKVAIVGSAAAAKHHVKGLALTVRRTDGGRGSAPIAVKIPTKILAGLYGADYAARTRWITVPADSTEAPVVTSSDVVPSTMDSATKSVIISPNVSSKTLMVAAVSAPVSTTGTGSFAATSLKPASSWDVSAQTGDFSWQYPMATPPAAAGPSPSIGLTYDSQSVDGETGSTNNQPSAIGDGWSLGGGGFIERSYVSCSQDDGASGAVTTSGDLCWKTDNATLDLGGHTGQLVRDSTTGAWKLQSDDGSRIEHLSGAAAGCNNATYDDDCWRITTTDGTQYYFGMNELPGWSTGKATTNSAWTVPVFGNDAGEPCHASTFAASSCTQAWRWNLDYVVDPHANAEAFYYVAEGNHYAKDGTGSTAYIRGGQLDHVDYGMTSSTVYAASAASDKVTFNYHVDGRCTDSTDKTCTKEPFVATVKPTTPSLYPDTPFDQLCTSTTTCTGNVSPTFFTTGMLDTVFTSVRSGTTYSTVDQWKMSHSFPAPGDGTSAALLLTQVVHTGSAGTATLTEPATTFAYATMQNRVWTNGLAPLDKYRISSITASTGSVTSVNYNSLSTSDPQNCQVTTTAQENAFIAAANTNTSRCYPNWWVPAVTGAQTGRFDVFHKFVVTSVVTNPKTGGAYDPAQTTQYVYTGHPAWRYDTSPTTPAKQRTWSVFTGYNSVEVRAGDTSSPSSQNTTDYTFYQGMDGDRASTTGGTKSVSVTGAPGTPDSAWLAGQTRETKVLNGVGGAVVSDTVDTPWASTVEETDGTNSVRKVNTGETLVTEPTSSGQNRTTDTTTSFDSTYGLPLTVNTSHSDGPSTCQMTAYTAANTSSWIIGLPKEQSSVGVACSALSSAVYPKDAVSDVRTDYDGAGNGAAPTKGDATTVQTVDSYSGTTADTAHWVTSSTAAYDSMGRSTSATDVLGHSTTTAYTPASGGPLTKESQTNTSPFSWTSSTTYDPARGTETAATDEAGLTTTATYDALGRRIAVWLPGRAQATYATSPSIGYAYTESQTAALAVGTTSLTASGTTTSFALFDGLGQPIQTQAPSEGGGTMATDTQYDAQGRVSATNNTYWTASVTPSAKQFIAVSEQQISSETVSSYDASGRKLADISDSYGVEKYRTSYSYAGADKVSTTPPSGGTPTSTYTNSLGEKTSLVQYLASTPSDAAQKELTTYGYDAGGDMTSMKDPEGNAWSWSFDVLGHQIQAVDPDTGTSSSTYDDAGEVLSSTDARGQTLSYSYDALGRKTAEYSGSTSGSLLDSWSYDSLANGKLTSSSSYTGSTPGVPGAAYTNTVRGYTAAGLPTGSTVSIPASAPAFGGTSYSTMLQYYPDGSLGNQFDPAAGGIAAEREVYSYDSLGNENNVSGTSNYAGITYNAIGQIAQINHGGTVPDYTTYGYNATSGAIIGITDRTGLGTANAVQLDHFYSRDDSGNITSDVETGPVGTETQCYGYDHLQELTQAWTPSTGSSCATAPTSSTLGGAAPYWKSYTYDSATGNRLTSTQHNTGSGSDKVDTYSYPAAGTANPHGVQSVSTAQAGTTTNASYSYDAIGDTTALPGQTLTYDAEGKLATDVTSAGTQSNVYDADGNLLVQTDPTGGSTLYVGNTELHEASGSSTVTATRTYSVGSIPISERTSTSGSEVVYSLNADVDGTVDLEEAVATGAVTRRFADPFGNPLGSPVSWSDTHGFLNKSTSAFSGLTQIGARDYDPSLGRFLSVDAVLAPNNPLQNNGYAYGDNSPLLNMDPSGNCLEANSDSLSFNSNCAGGHGLAAPGAKPNPGHWKPPVAAGNSGSRGAGTGHNYNDYASRPQVASCNYGASYEQCTNHGTVKYQKPNPKSALITLNVVTGLATVGVGVCAFFTVGICAIAGPGEADAALIGADVAADGAAIAGETAVEGSEAAGASADEVEAEESETALRCGGNSFAAGTLVLLANGKSVPISTVKVGDLVQATDTRTGQNSSKPVSKLWLNLDDDLMDIRVTANGASSVIHATQHHRFWDFSQKKWREANQLRVGDELRSSNGTAVLVTGTSVVPGEQGMWDLTVSGDHDFYVLAAESSVLVHNCGDDELSGLRGEAGKFSRDELAQFAHGHTGEGVVDGVTRPPLSAIRAALESQGTELPGQLATKYQIMYRGANLKVIINESNPFRSTTYYYGQ